MTAAADDARPGFVTKTLALTKKDLTIELRGRDTLPPMLAFSVAVTLLLAFSLPPSGDLERVVDVPVGGVPLVDVVAGFLWVTILFAGLIAFARTFEVERDEGASDSLVLIPLDRSGLFAAKAVANLALVVVVEAVLVPIFVLIFSPPVSRNWPELILLIVLVDIAFTVIGTLFSAVAAQTRSRELILPVLALPALVPVFIAAVELTSDLFAGAQLTQLVERGWFGILLAFDVIFTIVGALTFELAIE